MNNATEISEDVGEVGITDVQVTIPSVFTGYQSGQSILQALQQFEVTATISSEGQGERYCWLWSSVTNPSMSFLSLIGIFFLVSSEWNS